MTYRVRVDPAALRQIDEFAAYLRNYSEDFAIEQIERLNLSPHARSISFISGMRYAILKHWTCSSPPRQDTHSDFQ